MPKIKLTGKGGEGGAGGGKGESKFERLWRAVLRDPNPSTIRTFKELFDVADPSQTLFPGGSSATTGVKIDASQQNQLHRELLRSLQAAHKRARMASHSPAAARAVAATYSRVQHLKTVARHAGIPLEDTFTRMEGPAREEYLGYMKKHQAYTRSRRAEVDVRNERIARKQAESQQRLAVRQAAIQQKQERVRQAQEVRLNKDHAVALDMDRARTERIARSQQKTASSKQAQEIRLNKDHAAALRIQQAQEIRLNKDHAAALRIQQAQESRAFGGSAAGIAAKYRASMASSAIGGAERAVAVGTLSEFRKHYNSLNKLEKAADKQVKLLSGIKGVDDKELQLAQQHLAQVKSAKSRAEVVGQSRWGRRATKRTGSGFGGIMEDALGASVVGDFLDPLAIGTTVAIGAGLAAYKATDMIGGIISATKPYTSARLGASRLSGQFGYSGDSKALFDQFYANKKAGKGWMERLGLTTEGALNMASAFGIQSGGPAGTKHVVEQLRKAQATMPFLRGMSDAQLGGISRQVVVAGITSSLHVKPILQEYQKVIAAGTEEGVNRAASIHALSSSIGVLANNMGFSTWTGKNISKRIGGMMESGLPSMRSGQGEAGVFASMENAQKNVLGSPARLTMLYDYLIKGNHGHLPDTAAELTRKFGKGWYQKMESEPGTALGIKTYEELAKMGSRTLAIKFLKANMPYNTLYKAGENFNQSQDNTGPIATAIKIATSGLSVRGYEAYDTKMADAKQGQLIAAKEKPYAKYLMAAAKKYHISASMLAGFWGAESSGTNPVYSGHGPRGPWQFERSTWNWITKGKLPFSDASNIPIAAQVEAKLLHYRMTHTKLPYWNLNAGAGLQAWGGSAKSRASYKARGFATEIAFDTMMHTPESEMRKRYYAANSEQAQAKIKRSSDVFDTLIKSGLVNNFQALNNQALDLGHGFASLGDAVNKLIDKIDGKHAKPRTVHPVHYYSRYDVLNPYAAHTVP